MTRRIAVSVDKGWAAKKPGYDHRGVQTNQASQKLPSTGIEFRRLFSAFAHGEVSWLREVHLVGLDQKSAKILRGGSFNPSTTSNSALQKGFRRLLHYWESAWESGRRDGLLILLWQILVRCSAPLASVALLCLYERDLNQAVPEIESLAEIAVTAATESDIELIGAQIAADFEGGSDALPAVHRRIRFRLELGQI